VTVGFLPRIRPNSRALAPEQRLLVERTERAVDDIALIEGKLLTHTLDTSGEDYVRERYAGRFEKHGLSELDLPGFGEPYTREENPIPAVPKSCTSVMGDCRR